MRYTVRQDGEMVRVNGQYLSPRTALKQSYCLKALAVDAAPRHELVAPVRAGLPGSEPIDPVAALDLAHAIDTAATGILRVLALGEQHSRGGIRVTLAAPEPDHVIEAMLAPTLGGEG